MVNTFGEYQSPKKSKLFGNKNLNHPNNKHTFPSLNLELKVLIKVGPMRHETIYNFFLFDLKTNGLIFLKISLIPIIKELQIFVVHWKDSNISYIMVDYMFKQTIL
jgi:hypothetical protein